MNKIILILILTAPLGAIAQFFERFDAGIELGGNYVQVGLAERVESNLLINGSLGVHKFYLGPILQLYANEAQSQVHEPKLTGIQGGYLIALPTQSHRLELTFSYDFTLQEFENKWAGTFYDYNQQDYLPYTHEAEEFFSAHMLGYGFKYNASRRFYIRTQIAAGVFFSNLWEESKGNNIPPNVIYDFRGYSNFGTLWKTNLSFGLLF